MAATSRGFALGYDDTIGTAGVIDGSFCGGEVIASFAAALAEIVPNLGGCEAIIRADGGVGCRCSEVIIHTELWVVGFWPVVADV